MAKKNWAVENTLQSATQLSDNWVPVGGTLIGAGVMSGGTINGKGFDQISYLLIYNQGDETQLDLKVQFSDTESFTNAYERIVTDTSNTGLSNILENTFRKLSSASFEFPLSLRGWYVRLLAKRSGGTPEASGTLAAKYRLENVNRN